MAYSNKIARSIFSLPEEIVFLILVQLPAHDIYHSLRFVCRQWYNIISSPQFIKEHLLGRPSGLLFQLTRYEIPTYTTFGESSADMTETHLPPLAEICATCDGLAVVCFQKKVYVANLLTKQTMLLPPTNPPLEFRHMYDFTLVKASRSTTSDYKVFLTYHRNFAAFYITLGKDSVWRPIHGDNNLIGSRRRARKILGIGSTIYWFFDLKSPVFAFDADSETLHELPNPAKDHAGKTYIYSATGNGPSFIVRMKKPEAVFDVWLMPESSNCWNLVTGIDLSPHSDSCFMDRIFPAAWVKNGEMLVFHQRFNRSLAYNVKTGRSFKFGKKNTYEGFFADFVYSLVQLPAS